MRLLIVLRGPDPSGNASRTMSSTSLGESALDHDEDCRCHRYTVPGIRGFGLRKRDCPTQTTVAEQSAPADVYKRRGAKIRKMREEIKTQTIRRRRLQHQTTAAEPQTDTEPEPPLPKCFDGPKNSDDGQCRGNGRRPRARDRFRPGSRTRSCQCGQIRLGPLPL